MVRADPGRTRIRRNVELDKQPAVLGDASGIIYEPGNRAYVRVRHITSSGLGWPITVGLPRRPVAMLPNTAVWVYYDPDEGELAIWGPRIGGQLAQGLNPNANQMSLSDPSGDFVDLTKALPLLSHPTPEPGLSVAVKALIYIRDGTVHQYAGGLVDLTSTRPGSAGEHCLAGLFLKEDDTIEAVTSTAKSALDPFVLADVQECVDGATAGFIASTYWTSANGQTTFTAEHHFLDLRNHLGVSSISGYTLISSGAVAPASTPSRVGLIYIDTVLQDVYISAGTSSSADWIKVN